MSFGRLLDEIQDAIMRNDGYELSKKISLSEVSSPELITQMRHPNAQRIIRSKFSSLGDSRILIMVEKIMSSKVFYFESEFDSAFTSQNEAFTVAREFFSNKEESTIWFHPVIARIGDDLRLIAEEAEKRTGVDTLVRLCINEIREAWKICFPSLPIDDPKSKRLAVLSFTNLLFKICFKLKNFKLCETLYKALQSKNVERTFERFDLSEVVMYRFYMGRLKMLEEQLVEAREHLMFCLDHTPDSEGRNKQLILLFLVPLQISNGTLPSELISHKYGLVEYYQLGCAIRTGNVPLFDQLMDRHQACFIRSGVFLLLEQSRSLTYFNLIKQIIKNLPDKKTVYLDRVLEVLMGIGIDMESEELECILSNLIFKRQIRGCLVHEPTRRYMALSGDPFPLRQKIA